ncbi:MAG: FecR domain-containing protein [Mediterranea sp.]|nr:FecR domain-containing protein [Mediterranea sp.]
MAMDKENPWYDLLRDASLYTPDTDYYWTQLQQRMKVSDKTSYAVKSKNYFRILRYAAVACLLVAVSWMGFKMLHQPAPSLQLQYACVNGKSMVTLPDSSKVWMNSDTQLNYTTASPRDERSLTLQGEAYFDVSHDVERAFVVQTDGMQIMVHGTKFNVEALPNTEYTSVSLLEGSVSLTTGTETRMLKPGETAVYDRRSRKLSVRNDDVQFAASWAKEKLTIDQRVLGDIVPLLQKWYRMQIELDPAIADISYTFTLRNESPEEIVRLMSRVHPQVGYRFDESNRLVLYEKK